MKNLQHWENPLRTSSWEVRRRVFGRTNQLRSCVPHIQQPRDSTCWLATLTKAQLWQALIMLVHDRLATDAFEILRVEAGIRTIPRTWTIRP